MQRTKPDQSSQFESPWKLTARIRMILWEWAWILLCSWTPKPFNLWRLLVLRFFGATIKGRPFVHQRARIQIPWHLTLGDRACLGDRANAYSLGPIEIEEGVTIAQEAYLCTGTHDFNDSAIPLQTGRIHIKRNAFIGVRAMILPDITIGEKAIVGAQAVVTKNVAPSVTVAGNPAVKIREH
jgi:putative colanic acid biosynthesis acetyltransferase WcaF